MASQLQSSQNSELSFQDLISIVIPVYNTGEYLVECLQSCLNQTYSNLEVIAVDDCSTDPRTIEILKEFENKDSRIKVVWSRENHGQGYCRNVGVDQCQGKYFAFIDSDDYFKPEFVEKMYQGLEEYQTDFAVCDTFNYVDDPKIYEQHKFKVLDEEDRFDFVAKDRTVVHTQDLAALGFLISFPPSCYGKMFNTQKYKESGLCFYDGEYSRHCQDEDWATYTVLKLKNFVVLKFVGLSRRMHANTASSPSLNYYRCSIDAAYRRYQAIKDYPFSVFYVNAIIDHMLMGVGLLSQYSSNYAERLKVLDLAHNYLVKCNNSFNINPYHYSPVTSGRWAQVLSTLDAKPLPVLYVSLRSLHNAYWSETYTTKLLLENLAARGLVVAAFTALCNSNAVTIKNYGTIEQELRKFESSNNKEHSNRDNSAIFEFNDNGVRYYIAKTTPFTNSSKFSAQDHLIVNEGLSQAVDFYTKTYQQCLVLVSGGDLETQKQCLQLKKKGVKLVYLIDEPDALHFENKNGQDILSKAHISINSDQDLSIPDNTKFFFAPHDFDAVVGMNAFYAQCFSKLYSVKAESLGYAVNPLVSLPFALSQEQPDRPKPSFITFTNPTLEHGLAIVIKLVERFSKLHPEQKFLIVQDQDHALQQDLIKLHDSSGKTLVDFKDALRQIVLMSDAQVDPIALSGKSKVLLVPGLSNTSSLSSVLECQINNVPVIFSRTKKYQAVANAHDQCLPLPASVEKDPSCLPNDEEITPWVQALEAVLCSVPEQTAIIDKQSNYHQTMDAWVRLLYTIAGVPEIHDHA